MDYYQKTIYIPKVDKNDTILGKIERWEAHKNGILHRGFTAVLRYQDKIIVQHRKHPVFDGFYDVSFSSHQTYDGDRLLSPTEVIVSTLKREWIWKTEFNVTPEFIGKFYYREKDPKSEYFEHEINHMYQIDINEIPEFNPEFAYGMEAVDKSMLKAKNGLYAPWVVGIFKLL